MSSIYTRFVTDVIDVRGVSVTIRKLAPKVLAEAEEVAMRAAQMAMRRMHDTLGEQLFADARQVSPEAVEAYRASVAADPLRSYDRVTLMAAGITAWTLTGPDGAPVEVSPETVADLDDEAQATIAGAILKLSRPSLYQTEAEREAAQKNG